MSAAIPSGSARPPYRHPALAATHARMSRPVLLPLALMLCLSAATLPCAQAQAPATAGAAAGVPVAQATLDSYSGRYRTADGLVLRVWREGSLLKLQVDTQAPLDLLGESESTFRVRGQEARVAFTFNAANRVDALELSQGGARFRALRQ